MFSAYDHVRENLKTLGQVLTTQTSGKGTYNITDKLVSLVEQSQIQTGTATVFVPAVP
jgi:thiamine phosphate synthase YjbQ (UPF0047 family)